MKKLILSFTCLLFAGALGLFGQTVTPTFTGVVTDLSGTPIPNMVVSVEIWLNPGNSVSGNVLTDAAGVYSFTSQPLNVGQYPYDVMVWGQNCQDSAFGMITGNNVGQVTFNHSFQTPCNGQVGCNIAWGWQGSFLGGYNFWHQGQNNVNVQWDFGDGTTSTQHFPSHTYANPGVYTVCFTYDNCAPQCTTIVVNNNQQGNCNVAWGYTPDTSGFSFNFWHQGQNTSLVTWTFYTSNGNFATSNQHFPSYSWNAPGTYVVCFQIDSCPQVCDTIVVGNNGGGCNFAFGGYPTNNTQDTWTFWHQGNVLDTVVWDFGDGSVPSSQPFPTHTYSSPGTYVFCVTVGNCAPQCDTIVVPPGCNTGDICGTVIAGNNIGTPAIVYLIEYDPQNQTLTALQTTGTNPSGGFCFTGIPNGAYLVKAALTPNSPDYSNYLPTYYSYDLHWYDAIADSEMAIVNCNQITLSMNLVQGVNPGGPGFIGGSVLSGANLIDNSGGSEEEGENEYSTDAVGDPVPDVSVLLFDINDNPVTHTVSDVNGDFQFSNLAYGTYKLYPELVGLQTYPIYVTIDAANPSVNGFDFYVNTTYVSGMDDETSIIGDISVFPNPVVENAQVRFELKTSSDIRISVEGINGQTISEQTQHFGQGTQVTSINMSAFAQGIYLVRMTDLTHGNTAVFKIVK